ncbi:1-(5-phosphoribosyl)-5-[(5-phosphoribosylamino)methylideneamino]imidazole-4-carboxamide isomerase [Campylobacter sp. MIT 99-7217]|uniref:1-(5-phosphoribosyl)-5-[(5- phosphoribosylamino)methylideneamino]imidazole-4- carboxamide isomerase n=1 Tax=Campylobacter sp. MIT 99-7217 TaxID=535091 RepID=UPI001157A96A|nr:1-(5-phosphoribosyl)-5-[(5-phosphoribosylamino)methylideneamino]imidazole-4-carboxamide isomerase [Campylobacter sp. MIT 99-7217]TQR29047.1 1-(5-phosphoribosyl)-5-[(5-phosphoribosylamino)methylideneamino]imidazole-4-carboxamide isomerase [Campylobacter sp. MIT 99-7217]
MLETKLIPALDLINGKVVRLFKGAYEDQKIYEFEPLAKFKEYEKAGAKWLHLVDLSGAKEPEKRQNELIKKLCSKVSVNLQVGGGIRSKEDIKALLNAGAKRVVIGSLALRDKEFTKELLKEFGSGQITLALDVIPKKNKYFVATNAWQERSDTTLFELLEFYAKAGLKHLLCTDISKDGTLSGANVRLYTLIHEIFAGICIQASGGVNSLEDLKALKGSCSGIIVGKALLDGVFSAKEGVECLQKE